MSEDKKILNLLTIGDALHDFKKGYPAVKGHADLILSGLPSKAVPDNINDFIKDPSVENKLLQTFVGYDNINSIIDDLKINEFKKTKQILL